MSLDNRMPPNIKTPTRLSSRQGSKGNRANKRGAGFMLDTQRKAALAKVDQAPFSLFHAKVALVAGAGFFTDAYDTFAIDLVIIMAQVVYGNNLTPARKFGLKAASTCGTIVGQLLFGWLGDVYGRKSMYGVELVIIIIGTLGQALAGQAERVNIFAVITFYRFIMGIGIGGDYPISSIISAEFAPARFRGRMMTLVFSAQGWGQLTAAIVSILSLSAFHVNVDAANIDSVWRILLGLGCIPATVALFFRLTIPETPRFTMDIERNVNQAIEDVDQFLNNSNSEIDSDAIIQRANAPRASWKDFTDYFGKWDNLGLLLGTSWSWFALDIAFYGMNLNTPILFSVIYPECLDSLGGSVFANSPKYLRDSSIVNIVLSLGGLLPGFVPSFFLIDRWGRRPIQLLGFCVLSVIFLLLGFGYNQITRRPTVFFFLYCLANFFANFGPNTTTFIIPGELFPTRYRSTSFGIAAASGKVGAVIAQVCFYAAQLHTTSSGGACTQTDNTNVKTVLTIFAFFMISGVASTYFLIPETNGISLEKLSNESQNDFITGVAARVERTEDGLIITERMIRLANLGNDTWVPTPS